MPPLPKPLHSQSPRSVKPVFVCVYARVRGCVWECVCHGAMAQHTMRLRAVAVASIRITPREVYIMES